MTGEDFKLSGTRADFDTAPGSAGQPIVTMEFTGAGSDKFEEITRNLHVRGRLRQAPQHFAIVLDREIRTFPRSTTRTRAPAGGIGGGRAQITGLESIQEAKDIAIVLQTGALPVKFVTLDRTDISATLGKDSLEEAQTAAIAGLVLVIFLLFFYRFLARGRAGWVSTRRSSTPRFDLRRDADAPGFCGARAHVRVAADANIVIFERIKEEVRAGRSMRAAIGQGYRKGFATIVDANVVTAITAMVLFVVATASVRGFALMLLIGTALDADRGARDARHPRPRCGLRLVRQPEADGRDGPGAPALAPDRLHGHAPDLVRLLGRGRRGLDRRDRLRAEPRHRLRRWHRDDVPDAAADRARAGPRRRGRARSGNAVIQGRGASVDGEYTSFQIRTESLPIAEQNELQQDLAEAIDATAFGAQTVSESFGGQIANAAIFAIVVSLLLIVLYLAVRFQWKYSVGVLVALAHDIVITVGVYALTGRRSRPPRWRRSSPCSATRCTTRSSSSTESGRTSR